MKRVLISIVLVASIGCSDERPTTPPEVATPTSPAPARDHPTEVEMVASMEAHYSVVILAHDALLLGDLESFRTQLTLASTLDLPPTSPQQWLPIHKGLQAAAREGENVTDLETAASTLANVVLACGTCHAALGSGPVYPAPAPDDAESALKVAMRDHQWATERLWEGVTGPWDNAWQRGAEAISTTTVFGEAEPKWILTDDLRRREQELREIGVEAKAVTALDARARLYGRLLKTCGECHRLIGIKFEKSD